MLKKSDFFENHLLKKFTYTRQGILISNLNIKLEIELKSDFRNVHVIEKNSLYGIMYSDNFETYIIEITKPIYKETIISE